MNTFHWVDYLVLAAVLLASLGTGVFFAFSGGKQKTTGEYFRGNQKLNIVPTAMSIMASYVSGIMILGTPAEVFLYGGMNILSMAGVVMGSALAAFFFVPMFYPLGLTSINVYLQMRFNSAVPKLICTAANILFTILYSGLVIYAPATTISLVTGFPMWLIILVSATVVIIYTSIGGIKGVIWTDAFQSVCMFAGMLAVAITSIVQAGGVSKTIEYNKQAGRLDLLNFDPDPRVRLTFWTTLMCSTFSFFLLYGATQTTLQRYCGMPTLAKARQCMFLVMFFAMGIFGTAHVAGWGIFAYYSSLGCDPMSSGAISTPNQLVPYFVMETMNYPGVPGLFVAAMCAGGLSSASSVLNSASANTWCDFIQPTIKFAKDSNSTLIAKGLVVFYGILAIGTAFLASTVGGTITQISLSFNGSIMVVVTGTILFAAICPWANWKGASAGAVCGFSFTMWLAMGSYSMKSYATDMLPLIDGQCDFINNITDIDTMFPFTNITDKITMSPFTNGTIIDETPPHLSWYHNLMRVNFHWYKIYGSIVITGVGTIVSLLTRNKNEKPDPSLLFGFIGSRIRKNQIEKVDSLLHKPEVSEKEKDKEQNKVSVL